MKSTAWRYGFASLILVLLVAPFLSGQGGGPSNFNSKLSGDGEVPAVSSKGGGEFRATVQNNNTEMAFSLEYNGLSGPATMAHIHFGQSFTTGGVVVHLCGSGGAAACPGAAGTVTGAIGASRVVDATTQGISAGEFAEVLAAIRAGNAYVNIHTTQSPPGEIRGQLKPGRGVTGDDAGDEEEEEGAGNGRGRGQGKGKGNQ